MLGCEFIILLEIFEVFLSMTLGNIAIYKLHTFAHFVPCYFFRTFAQNFRHEF